MNPQITHQNSNLTLKQAQLVESAIESTVLTDDIASGSSTLTVANINGFAVNQVLLIGNLGDEGAEIIKTHVSTAPTGSTVTLASNTVHTHERGTRVYVLEYDQIELSHAATATGSKTLLTTALGSGLIAVEADNTLIAYDETEYSSGYYFARYKNSIDASFSSYSDASPYGGWGTNTVAHAISYALKRNGLEDFNAQIDKQFCLDEINACLQNVQGKQVRWEQYQNYNAILGETARGSFIMSLPDDIYTKDSNRALLGLRIGDSQNLSYEEPDDWEGRLGELKYTQVRTEASATDITLEVDNSYDFKDSGTVTVFVANTKYDITYTGVTRDDAAGGTATLTGVPASGDGAITVTIPVDTYVYQDYNEGEPTHYTIKNQQIEYYPLPDGSNDHMNVYADYWTVASVVDSQADELDTARHDMVKSWLTWKMRSLIKNEGKLDMNDGDYLQYRDTLNDAVRTRRAPTRRMIPKVNGISYKNRRRR